MSSDADAAPAPAPAPEPDKETHVGTCHCQAIKFTVRVPPLADVGACDCSHCVARGLLWGFCDNADFALERGGPADFAEYEFAGKKFKHLSCKMCRTHIAGAPSADAFPAGAGKTIGYNVRALRDVDVHELPITTYPGKGTEPAYVPAEPFRPALELADGQQLISGSCHCHAVRFAVRTYPLGGTDAKGEKVVVKDCNCSICGGNGMVWVYPLDADFVLAPGAEAALDDYAFQSTPKANHFYSCKTCGCCIYEKREGADGSGVNVRLMDVDLAKVDVTKSKNARAREPQYVVK